MLSDGPSRDSTKAERAAGAYSLLSLSHHSSECLLSVSKDTRSPRKTRGVRYPLRGITYKAQTIAKLGVRPPNYCHVPSSCLEVSFEPGADRRFLVHSDWKMDSVSVLWVCGR